MAEVTLSSKNQIVVPKEAREALGVKPGDKLLVTVLDGEVTIMKRPANFLLAIQDLTRGIYGDDYLKEERASWKSKKY